VNDSARAMMSAAAKLRGDISGSIQTAGSASGYTLTSFQGFSALQAELFIAFNLHATNNATCTINVDGLGAKPLRSAPGVEIGNGVLVQGTPYTASYFTSNGGEWILNGFYGSPFVVPVGALVDFVGSVPPSSNFAFPVGQAISRTTYATLFGLCGLLYGAGDGSTTFNVPDLRSRARFGWDGMAAASNRITVAGGNFDATVLGGTQDRQNWTLTAQQIPAHTHALSGSTGNDTPDHTHSYSSAGTTVGGVLQAGSGASGGASFNTGGASVRHTHPLSGNTDGGTGGGQSHPIVPPAVVVSVILRVL